MNSLLEILRIPTKSGKEDLMVNFIKSELEKRNIKFKIDGLNNIYATKGISNKYPLFLSHTDTVHEINNHLELREVERYGKKAIIGYNTLSNSMLGLGGDDKCGVYLALRMLDKLDFCKVAFLVSEEVGCIGIKYLLKNDPLFFIDVDYCIEYDSPGLTSSYTLRGMKLFNCDISDRLIESHNVEFRNHSCTDVYHIRYKYNLECYNLPASYYKQHTTEEYVIHDDLEISLNITTDLMNKFKNEKSKLKIKLDAYAYAYA